MSYTVVLIRPTTILILLFCICDLQYAFIPLMLNWVKKILKIDKTKTVKFINRQIPHISTSEFYIISNSRWRHMETRQIVNDSTTTIRVEFSDYKSEPYYL